MKFTSWLMNEPNALDRRIDEHFWQLIVLGPCTDVLKAQPA